MSNLRQENINLLRKFARPKTRRRWKSGRLDGSSGRVTVNGTEQPSRLWVNDGDQQQTVVWNAGVNPDLSGVEVTLTTDPDTGDVYASVDVPRAVQTFGAATPITKREPAPAETIDEPVVTRRIKSLRFTQDTSNNLTARISAGFYRYNGVLKQFDGGTLALSSTFSAITSGNHRWIVIGINASTDALTSATGSEVTQVTPLAISDALNISLSAGVFALWLIDALPTDTSLNSVWRAGRVYDLRSLYDFSDLAFSFTGLASGDVIYYDGSEFVNTPLLNGSQQVLADYGGTGADLSAANGLIRFTAGVAATTTVGTSDIDNDAITSDKIATGAVGSDELAATSVTANSYTAADITVDADGRLTAASSNTLGTMAAQDATNVNIDGGTIDDTTITLAQAVQTPLAISRDGGNSFFQMTAYVGANALIRPGNIFRRARGSLASPSASQSGDVLADTIWQGYDGSSFATITRLFILATENHSSTNLGSKIRYQTTQAGGTSQANLEIGAQNSSSNPSVQPQAGTWDLGASGGAQFNDAHLSNVLIMYNSSAPSGTTGTAKLVAISGNLWGYSSAGVGTQLTSHPDWLNALFDTSGRATNYIIRDRIDDKETQVDVVGALLDLEATTGNTYIKSRQLRRGEYIPRVKRKRMQRKAERQTRRANQQKRLEKEIPNAN